MGLSAPKSRIAVRWRFFTADEGIARNSTARTIFTHFLCRRNRGSLAIFFAEEIAHLGASKDRAISPPQPQRIARFWRTQLWVKWVRQDF